MNRECTQHIQFYFQEKEGLQQCNKSSFKIPITSHLMRPNSSWYTQKPFRIMCAKCYFLASVSRNSFAENIVQENVHLVLKSTYLKGLENKGFKIGVPTIESSLFDVRWCISNMVGWFSLVTKRDTNSNKTRCLCLDACIQFISLV